MIGVGVHVDRGRRGDDVAEGVEPGSQRLDEVGVLGQGRLVEGVVDGDAADAAGPVYVVSFAATLYASTSSRASGTRRRGSTRTVRLSPGSSQK